MNAVSGPQKEKKWIGDDDLFRTLFEPLFSATHYKKTRFKTTGVNE